MAAEAMQSLLRHSWYLTEQLIVFALWDPRVPSIKKRRVATKLANTPFPAEFSKEKPKLLESLPLLPRIPQLKDFIGPQSHLLFHLLRAGTNWLRQPVSRWS